MIFLIAISMVLLVGSWIVATIVLVKTSTSTRQSDQDFYQQTIQVMSRQQEYLQRLASRTLFQNPDLTPLENSPATEMLGAEKTAQEENPYRIPASEWGQVTEVIRREQQENMRLAQQFSWWQEQQANDQSEVAVQEQQAMQEIIDGQPLNILPTDKELEDLGLVLRPPER